MAPYLVFILAQAFIIQTVFSQAINRIVQTPIEGYLPVEGVPGQVILSQPYPGIPAPYPASLAEPVYTPVVIQDSSVANNLANVLQLLVVSNLLSTTLPGSYDPGCFDPYIPVAPCPPVIPYGYFY